MITLLSWDSFILELCIRTLFLGFALCIRKIWHLLFPFLFLSTLTLHFLSSLSVINGKVLINVHALLSSYNDLGNFIISWHLYHVVKCWVLKNYFDWTLISLNSLLQERQKYFLMAYYCIIFLLSILYFTSMSIIWSRTYYNSKCSILRISWLYTTIK